MYGKSIKFDDASDACQLYYAAKKYNVDDALNNARIYMLYHLEFSNASEFNATAELFDDKEITEECREIFIQPIYDTTKHPEFFENTIPLDFDDDKVFFETQPIAPDSKINEAFDEYLKEIQKEPVLFKRINQYLGFIRYLTSKASSIFKLMIPRSVAKLVCSLLWVPPKGTFNDLRWNSSITCKEVNKCKKCLKTPSSFSCCGTTQNFEFNCDELFSKTDIGTWALDDIQKLYRTQNITPKT